MDRRLPQSQACRVQYAHQARRFHLHQTSITLFPCLYACAAHVRDCLRSLARQPAWFVHVPMLTSARRPQTVSGPSAMNAATLLC